MIELNSVREYGLEIQYWFERGAWKRLTGSMKIFIIGGAGYIGSHMVKISHKAGHDMVKWDPILGQLLMTIFYV